jgi:hypothetical protein
MLSAPGGKMQAECNGEAVTDICTLSTTQEALAAAVTAVVSAIRQLGLE